MNTLHLHATDDEGWRIEIPELPELTSYAAYRCAHDDKFQCLEPQYGRKVSQSYQNDKKCAHLRLAH